MRTFGDWGDPAPGYIEADLVAHCGGSMAGSFVHSFVLTVPDLDSLYPVTQRGHSGLGQH